MKEMRTPEVSPLHNGATVVVASLLALPQKATDATLTNLDIGPVSPLTDMWVPGEILDATKQPTSELPICSTLAPCCMPPFGAINCPTTSLPYRPQQRRLEVRLSMQRFLKISHLQVRASEWSIARVYQTYETGQALPWLSTVDFVADGLSLARINAFPLRHHEPYSCRGTDLKGFCASYLPNVKEVGLMRTTSRRLCF